MVAALLFTFTACGGDASTSQEGTASNGQEAVATAQEPATVESALPKVDTGAAADSMLGEWKDTVDNTHFSKITKTDSGYQLEDNDGKYPATFKEGKLSVKVTESDTAEAYIDTNTGHLFILFQDGLTEFAKSNPE